MSLYGIYKTAALSPRVTVASPEKNARTAFEMLKKADEEGVGLAVLPELHLSAYTCADLFHQDALILGCERALAALLEKTRDMKMVWLCGIPVRIGGALYNCAAVCQSGKILGVVPKTYLPNYQEYYEKRWFASGKNAGVKTVRLCGQQTLFGEMLFRFGEMVLGVELCEDVWVPVPPSSRLCLAGANVIANLSASNELVAKSDYRRSLIERQSGGCISGYIYASAGVGESTTDMVFSGACLIAENGGILAENRRFEEDGSMITGCIDVQKLMAERRKNGSFHDNAVFTGALSEEIPVVEGEEPGLHAEQIDRRWNPTPFIPDTPETMEVRCREIFAIQSCGLAKRLSHTGLTRAVIGISGGLDSTLALLVAAEAMKRLSLPAKNILAVTMPGFGTTDRTYQNALELIDSLGAELKEVDIRPACIQHMKDIGQDPDLHDITYENTQARQRTYILMDLANKNGGILVGTGDLSELAMGWCTYNGDHMSMYGVNASVPKTLVRHLVSYVASISDKRTRAVLEDVLDTPVSPELLPPDEKGQIQQKTEDTIGPYELHDFFLYHFMRFGFEREKLKFLALRAFEGKYDEAVIDKWLSAFYRRFFNSQFKRSCVPDSPKVGSVSVSPRGDWRMPSDADRSAWLY
ncbi:MAG: NAD(+) synthase [Candidatus Faecivivens sp.]|nr:NAD(+) synthase [Oscillospiraceae bacterium]MDY2712555.1 NAD(+) synthase [Candidatus Faecivivens sp.]